MPAKTSGWSSATVAGPFGRQLTLVRRRIQPDVRAVDAVGRVGANDEEMREALRDFDTRLALSLGLLWLVLSLAAYAQVSLGLRPLDRLRHELDRLRRSPAARLSDRHPQEILPLTEAINAMAAAREADLGRARRRAARSEEHTSELQSLMRISYAVFCLKKKKYRNKSTTSTLR